MNEKEYLDLIEKVNIYEKEYHQNSNSLISDEEFDLLKKKLEEFEIKNPKLVRSYSPTAKVGYTPLKEFNKLTHLKPMLSLNNSYNKGDILEFYNRIKNEVANHSFVLEYKIDGLSVALYYEKGIFVKGATRGDGSVGEDITENIKTIKSIPLKLKEDIDIVVRCEVFISKKDFNIINAENDNKYANPRNLASGSLRQLDANITAKRRLDAFIFEVIDSEIDFKTHDKKLDYLKKLGFKTSKYYLFEDINELINSLEKFKSIRDSLEFEIDGLVIKLNDEKEREKLSTTSKAPRWAIAYKFGAKRVSTIIKSVLWTVGRIGTISPTAVLKPVVLDGSMIARALMHNEDYINDKDIRLNDTVFIEKAGDVIPQIVSVDLDKRVNSIKIEIPKECPNCGFKLTRELKALRCVNPNCSAIVKRQIEQFSSREAFNIDGLRDKKIEFLVDNNYLNDYSDIFVLKDKKELLLKEKGFGLKSVNKLIENIEKSKKIDFDKFVYALGIENVGRQKAKDLVLLFKDVDELMNAQKEELLNVEGFGEIISESVYDYFSTDKNISLIYKLFDYGVDIRYNRIDKKDISFSITGSFKDYKRNDIIEIIEKKGYEYNKNPIKGVNYLISGNKSGSKLKMAEKNNVEVISIEEFINMIGEENE